MAKMKKNSILPVMGLDPSKPAEYIDDQATPNCKNISINRFTIQKRLGTIQNGLSVGERILAYRELVNDDAHDLLRIGITTVYSMGYDEASWTDRAYTPLTADSKYRVDTALPLLAGKRILVFTNGKDLIRKWVGGSTEADDTPLGGATAIRAKYCIDYGSYLVLANIKYAGVNATMRVWWSDTGNPELWSGGNAGSKDLTEDSEDITGLSVYGNYLCIHKETAIYIGYLIDTTSVFHFERKNTGVGTVCFATIQNLPNGDQVFLARDGIHLFNGVSAPLIDSPIMDELRESMNSEQIYKCWSVVVNDKNEYWVGIPCGDQEEPETVYKYNYALGVCHKDIRAGITAVSKYTSGAQGTWANQVGTWAQATGQWDDTGTTKLFKTVIFGSSTGISSSQADTANDIDVAIDSVWESKDYQDEIGRMCRWLEMQLWAKGNSVKVEYSTDSGSTWSTIETKTLSADYPSDVSPLTLYFDVVSTKIRFRFSNNVLNEQFNLKQFVVWYGLREMTR
jgi:hypothetical protein